jgi:hypothetical protein
METDKEIKTYRYSNPDNRPGQGLLKRQGMVFLLEKSKVHPKHQGNEEKK